MRNASVKKITACRMHRMPQAVYYGSSARTRTPRLDQRDATFFFLYFFGVAAAFAGAGHAFW